MVIFVKADVNKNSQEFWLLGICFVRKAPERAIGRTGGRGNRCWFNLIGRRHMSVSLIKDSKLRRQPQNSSRHNLHFLLQLCNQMIQSRFFLHQFCQ